MQQHFRVLGWISLVLGVVGTLGVIACVLVYMLIVLGTGAAIFGIQASDPTAFGGVKIAVPFSAAAMSAGPLIVFFAAGGLFSVLQVLAGAGLLRRASWSRVAAIIVSALSLPGFPFGTAVGVYGLWVMFSQEGVKAWAEYTGAPQTTA